MIDNICSRFQLISQLESEKRGFETKSQELSDARDRIQLKLHQVEGEVERLQMQLLKEQNKDLNQNIPGMFNQKPLGCARNCQCFPYLNIFKILTN